VKNPRLPVPQAATGNQKIFHNNIMPLHASTVNVGENSGFIHKRKTQSRAFFLSSSPLFAAVRQQFVHRGFELIRTAV
jgi:hypothetical protein